MGCRVQEEVGMAQATPRLRPGSGGRGPGRVVGVTGSVPWPLQTPIDKRTGPQERVRAKGHHQSWPKTTSFQHQPVSISAEKTSMEFPWHPQTKVNNVGDVGTQKSNPTGRSTILDNLHMASACPVCSSLHQGIPKPNCTGW